MYCPESIILNSKLIFITIHTKCDYLTKSHIPKKEKINILRYEFIFLPYTKYRFEINKNGKLWNNFSNAIYTIKKKLWSGK